VGTPLTAPFRRSERPAARPRLAIALLLALLAAGCKADLYTNLDQRQANLIVATLREHGIMAERTIGKDDRVSVAVDDSAFAAAIDILNDIGLPKQEFASMGDVFKRDGLVSSPVQERAQMIYALSQELSSTVSDIDGVLSARVHLVLPENDPLRQQLVPSSASVFIRYHADAPVGELVPQVKMLVANGVAGLSYDKVSVILVPVAAHEPAASNNQAAADPPAQVVRADFFSPADWPLFGVGALAAALGAALTLVLRRQRQRVYPLRGKDPVKLP
jgi:type III secretion protein J